MILANRLRSQNGGQHDYAVNVFLLQTILKLFMKLTSMLCVAFLLFLSTAFAQTTPFEKECRLAGGGGFANGFGNATGGPDVWLQMSYRLSKNFSVATEFENMSFKRSTFYEALLTRKDLNKREISHNYVSFLIKYHLPLPSKVALAVVSGWTYIIQREVYYDYQSSNNQTSISLRQWGSEDYSIPFIVEANYPINKTFQAGIRVKYNLNDKSVGATYATGLAVSMKL